MTITSVFSRKGLLFGISVVVPGLLNTESDFQLSNGFESHEGADRPHTWQHNSTHLSDRWVPLGIGRQEDATLEWLKIA